MGMRVTTGMSMNLYRYNLQNSTRNVDYSRNMVLTHRKFNSFGEAPAAATQAWRLRRAMVNTDIYLSNNNDTYTRFNIAWATLGQASHDLTDLGGRKSDIYAASDPTASGRPALGVVLRQTAESVIQTINGAKSGENFLFAGDDELYAPFTWDAEGNLYYRGVNVNSGGVHVPGENPVPKYWGEIDPDTGLPSKMPNKITNSVDKAWVDYYTAKAPYDKAKKAYDDAKAASDAVQTATAGVQTATAGVQTATDDRDNAQTAYEDAQAAYDATPSDENKAALDAAEATLAEANAALEEANAALDEANAALDEANAAYADAKPVYDAAMKKFDSDYEPSDDLVEPEDNYSALDPSEWKDQDPFNGTIASEKDDYGVPKAAYDILNRGVQVFDEDNNPVLDENGNPTYEPATGATRAWAEYYVDQGNYEKLKRMSREEVPIDLGMGMLEDDRNKLVDGTYYNRALPGINMLGFGIDEDGDPKNVCMIMRRLGEIYENCNPDSGSYDKDDPSGTSEKAQALQKEAMRLLDKLKAGQSDVSEKYVEISAKSAFLEQNESRLKLQGNYLNEQLSEIEDVDLADAISQFSWDYYCYSAALKVGTQLLSQSLIDYMN